MPTAVVVDGAYFLRRFSYCFPQLDENNPSNVVLGLAWLVANQIAFRDKTVQLSDLINLETSEFDTNWLESAFLYRIFFYDCAPLTKKTHRPISKSAYDLSKSDTAIFRLKLHSELQKFRKIALRLGRLNDGFDWRPKPESVARWIANGANFCPTDEDFSINTTQKGVDMRLGLDIASMAFKRQVDQIILVAGDGDFVPAVKLARREGIDVVLVPMGGIAAKDLVEHVDGIRDFRPTGVR
jgi:uncharacterized LabA/DUF88 family protein